MGGSLLIVVLGPDPNARRTVGVSRLPVVIGRGPGAQINIVAAQRLSRLHFALVGDPGTGRIAAQKREGSIASTGGQIADTIPLRDGASLDAGDVKLQFYFPFPPTPGKPLALQVLHGPQRGERLSIPADGVTIGRHPRNGIVLETPKLSSFHARIRKSPDGWTLTDLHSRNGTRLNGVLLPADTPHLIDAGDLIDMVDVSLRVVAEGAEPLEQVPLGADGTILPAPGAVSETNPALPAVNLVEGGSPPTPAAAANAREGVPPFDPFVAMGVSQRPGAPRLDGPALIMAQGDPRGFKLKGPVKLGRGPDVDIRLLDEGVSQVHAQISPMQGGFAIRDLDSLNGVRLNGSLVAHAPLTNFDVVGIGNYRFLYIAPGGHFPVSRKSVGLGLSVYPRKPSRFLRAVEFLLILLALLTLAAYFVYTQADWASLGLPPPPRIHFPFFSK